MSQFESDSASLYQQASAVKKAHQAELMSKANVVGIGIGYRVAGGQRTDEVAIVVMVTEKKPFIQLSPEDILPDEIEGIRVDVQEVGTVTAL